MDDIDKLAETAETVAGSTKHTVTLSNGDVVEIYKCKTKHVGSVLRFVSSVFDELGIKKIGDTPNIDINNPVLLLQLIAKSTDNVFNLASNLCSIQSEEEFAELDVDDAALIITEEFKLNKDFFLNRVLPMVTSVK